MHSECGISRPKPYPRCRGKSSFEVLREWLTSDSLAAFFQLLTGSSRARPQVQTSLQLLTRSVSEGWVQQSAALILRQRFRVEGAYVLTQKGFPHVAASQG